MKKEGATMSGLSILGICLAVVGVLVLVWGFTLAPGKFLDPSFTSMATGGLVLVAIGLCMVAGLAPAIKIGSVWLAAIAVMTYIYILPDTDLIVRLIGFVPIVGLAVWLTTKLLK